MNEFALQEAVALIYRHVVLKKNKTNSSDISDITLIGHVCGVLSLNDQIELVLKFHDGLKQFTKAEFESEVEFSDKK